MHDAIIKEFEQYTTYIPPNPKMALEWCNDISLTPPKTWLQALSLSADCLTTATKNGNACDVQTAHTLVQILPMLVSRPPDSSLEDSHVHNFVAPLIKTVFGEEFQIFWANGSLSSDLKPDFLVSKEAASSKYNLVVGEVKRPNHRSNQEESDLVKLGKELKVMYNQLVVQRVSSPVVCGILIDGFQLSTYTFDLAAPIVYRMYRVCEVQLFQNIMQLMTLPVILNRIVQLKNIVMETSKKSKQASIEKHCGQNLSPHLPPLHWLSNQTCSLSRKKACKIIKNEILEG
ncbi:hypothetical protein DM01DRAFT_299896 [Hesseltinella vesiculosa]|uniref:Uncharacterized protein n=1 Tax=Hesseltinella vesiculosa TaxID=101127 RepID=A0A1X2GLY5_9FUNG|nr:hypothetical protein DM01DRAFT_299896 [Hesseltinella vesiculosa]